MSTVEHDLLGKPVSPPKPKFKDWLNELNEEAKKRDYAGGPLSRQTGSDCWRDAYEAGMSPADALTEDESYGE